jgi:hypothetical protein
MTPARQPQLFKAIKIEKPYEATALTDGWLCIKYLDGGEESLSTFADVSKGDIIRFGHTTHTSAPLSMEERCKQAGIIVEDMIIEFNKKHDAQVAKAAREQAQQSIDAAIEQLSDINKYACEEYEEANLSDNEREMRIHLEYGNRVWEVVRFLRSQQDNTSTKGGAR